MSNDGDVETTILAYADELEETARILKSLVVYDDGTIRKEDVVLGTYGPKTQESKPNIQAPIIEQLPSLKALTEKYCPRV